jgi:hypothetical protein
MVLSAKPCLWHQRLEVWYFERSCREMRPLKGGYKPKPPTVELKLRSPCKRPKVLNAGGRPSLQHRCAHRKLGPTVSREPVTPSLPLLRFAYNITHNCSFFFNSFISNENDSDSIS